MSKQLSYILLAVAVIGLMLQYAQYDALKKKVASDCTCNGGSTTTGGTGTTTGGRYGYRIW